MAKPRPYIAPPVLTPPPAPTGLTFVIPPTPARAIGFEVLADRIVFTNPVIELTEHIWRGKELTKKLLPERAFIAHGVLVIEEYDLVLPLNAFLIRTS